MVHIFKRTFVDVFGDIVSIVSVFWLAHVLGGIIVHRADVYPLVSNVVDKRLLNRLAAKRQT